ncbi:hypothetical protein EFK50_16570 [Nocardioides marmoriginsengisoli]|uniref:Uncharacterized protein n=1 Tax=Nocardioides marmoriginsengisoli TaxID=661483 RepID=A0A3N0CCM6_9ACTN|nr:hypothetical protein [Nocardioides marmoriginsengisoli]RNL61001.1 hypothetical protein EFK50_16570 [Nocardioides marmoriginsengisoli]
MTTRFFCDICTREVEIPEKQPEFRTDVVLKNPPEDHTASRQVGIRILRAIDGAWNAGHICNRCLRKALTQVIDQLKGQTR